MTWPTVPLDAVAEIQGGIQKQPKRAPRANAFPFLRVANVTASGLDLDDVHEIEVFDGELDRFRLQRGDLLVVEGNGSATQIGRAAVWDGSIKDAVHQNHLIRVRPAPELDERYLGLLWNSPAIRHELSRVASSTSGLHTLSVTKLKRIVLPLPPLAEQHLVVDLLEDHLSRLDAADRELARAIDKLHALWRSALMAVRNSFSPDPRAIGEIATTSLGKMLDAKRQSGEPTPYLRNINVRWGSFDLADLQTTPLAPEEITKFDVREGDIMVCEGGEPGRCAVWRGDGSGIAFQKALHRVRVEQGGEVLPDFLALMLEECIRSGRADRLFTGTTIKHLPQEKLRTMEIVVPSLEEQQAALQHLAEVAEAREQLQTSLIGTLRRSQALRRSLLAAAFSGRLTGDAFDLSEAGEMIGA